MRSDRVSLLIAALSVAAPAVVRAEAGAVRLDVDAPPSCSTRDELIARVAARSPRIRFVSDGVGIPIMSARIDAGLKGTVIAELTVVDPDGRRFARRLEAPSCAAATDALALVVAITLDPSAATGETAPPAEAKAAAPVVTVNSPPPTAPAAEAAGAQNGQQDGQKDGQRDGSDAGEAAPAASRRRLVAGVAGEVVTGPAPAAMPGVALEIQAALDRASIWSPAAILTLSHVWSGDLSETDGRATFTLDLLGLDACPVRVVLFRLEMRACAAASVGRLAAQGSHTYDPRSAARRFATAGGTIHFTVPVVWHVEVRARFGAGAALWRDAFEFTPDVFHRVASITLVGDVGVGVRFP